MSILLMKLENKNYYMRVFENIYLSIHIAPHQ
jgi:hypothetical protein